MAQFGTVITNIGLAKITNAQVTQETVGIKHMVLGDGNGAYYTLSQSQTNLKREVWRGLIADEQRDPSNPNRIAFSAYVPSTAGGFTIREVGLLDTQGNLIAVSLYPEQYKPQLVEGVSDDLLLHFVLETSNASVVTLAVDPTIVIASRKYVDDKVAGAVGNIGTNLTELQGQVATHLDDDVNHVKYAVATGTANTYAITLNPAPTSYVEGMAVSVKINVNASATSTLNVNGLGAKGIKKASGTDVTNLKANGIYTMRFDGVNFILQGEGGSGNANASDLLTGKTASTDAGDIVGTMPNRGTFNLGFGATVPAGYYSGGTVPNGKKWASGTGNASTTGTGYQYSYNFPAIKPNLTFDPSFALAWVQTTIELNNNSNTPYWYHPIAVWRKDNAIWSGVQTEIPKSTAGSRDAAYSYNKKIEFYFLEAPTRNSLQVYMYNPDGELKLNHNITFKWLMIE